MSSYQKKIMIDLPIFLSYMGKKYVKFKKEAEKIIEAISLKKLEATFLLEDVSYCQEQGFLTEKEVSNLVSLLKELKITYFWEHPTF